MSTESSCEHYPDIFEDPTAIVDEDRRNRIIDRNYRRVRLYGALREVLQSSEMMSVDLPNDPASFDQADLSDADRARFVAIFGMLVADNWEDPAFNKVKASADDKVIKIVLPPGATPRVDGESRPGVSDRVIITEGFLKAVLRAVHEHSRSPDLYTHVFQYLRDGELPSDDPAVAAASY